VLVGQYLHFRESALKMEAVCEMTSSKSIKFDKNNAENKNNHMKTNYFAQNKVIPYLYAQDVEVSISWQYLKSDTSD
jgi:hypothetical protein